MAEPVEVGATLRDAKARFERDCISAVLMRHHGRVPEAAKALGIQRTNLYRKIRQLNVARSWWHPTDYLRILYKRRWVAMPAFLLVFVSGALDTIRAVPIYEARTQLLIERDYAPPDVDRCGGRRPRSNGYYDDGFYLTQYNVIRSRSLALQDGRRAREERAAIERMPPPPGMSFSLTGLIQRCADRQGARPVRRDGAAPPDRAAGSMTKTASRSRTRRHSPAKAGRFLGGLPVVAGP